MTHFQDFTRDNGAPITVEFEFSSGSETTYSPASGACGGDGCYVNIIKAWPNTKRHDGLCRRWLDASSGQGRIAATKAGVLALVISFFEWFSYPNDVERERMEEWLIEHHVDDYQDEPEDWRL